METTLNARSCLAFLGHRLIASGHLRSVALKIKNAGRNMEIGSVLLLDAETSRPMEIDWRGSVEEVLSRVDPISPDAARRGPGRPKLGVVGKEVTLLPRHWEWLDTQPGGPSVALRKLVEAARRDNAPKDRLREAQESVHRFMTATAGDLPGYEEALRAFYAHDRVRFEKETDRWPKGIREHARHLAKVAGV